MTTDIFVCRCSWKADPTCVGRRVSRLPRVTLRFLSSGNIFLFGEVCNYPVITLDGYSILKVFMAYPEEIGERTVAFLPGSGQNEIPCWATIISVIS